MLIQNTKALQKDNSGSASELLSMIFIPFYAIFWWITRGGLVKSKFADHDCPATSNEFIYLLLGMFGLAIVSMAIMQNDFNNLASKPSESTK